MIERLIESGREWLADRIRSESTTNEGTSVSGAPIIAGIRHGPDTDAEGYEEYAAQFRGEPAAVLGVIVADGEGPAKVDVLLSETDARAMAGGFAELQRSLDGEDEDEQSGGVGFQ